MRTSHGPTSTLVETLENINATYLAHSLGSGMPGTARASARIAVVS